MKTYMKTYYTVNGKVNFKAKETEELSKATASEANKEYSEDEKEANEKIFRDLTRISRDDTKSSQENK